MKSILSSFGTTAGFLQNCLVRFSPKLTCIIGARGTCKSTVVETIRFAFDCDSNRVALMVKPPPTERGGEALPSQAGLIHATLGGGTARCELDVVSAGQTEHFVIERYPQGAPRVFRDGVQQVDGIPLLNRVEVFSQGELQTIAETPSRRLALIDRPFQNRRDQLVAERLEIGGKLRDLGQRIRQRRGDIEAARAISIQLPTFRTQLAEAQSNRPQLSKELAVERDAYANRKAVLDRARQALSVLDRARETARELPALGRELAAFDALFAQIHHPAASALSAAFVEPAKVLLALGEQLRVSAKGDAEALVAQIAASFEEQNQRFYELRKAQQVVNEALKKEEALRSEIEKLEIAERRAVELEEGQARDLAERTSLRTRLDSIGEELYALRSEQVSVINAEFGQQIVLALQQGGVSDDHIRLVADLLRGSNLRNQDDVAREIATKLRPAELVDAVESADPKWLCDHLGREPGQMARLLSHLLDSQRLYELEAIASEDVLEITLFVRGEAKPLHQLSKGQMATALLPLILRDAPYPLLVDQPEDDLDNAFISQALIERIRKLKNSRQLIFVTHNANIPVLGEADTVIVMEMDGPSRAAPPKSGTVDDVKDDILSLLEGGKEAFNQRQHRYGTALG